jgi:hypothetical protein
MWKPNFKKSGFSHRVLRYLDPHCISIFWPFFNKTDAKASVLLQLIPKKMSTIVLYRLFYWIASPLKFFIELFFVKLLPIVQKRSRQKTFNSLKWFSSTTYRNLTTLVTFEFFKQKIFSFLKINKGCTIYLIRNQNKITFLKHCLSLG